MIRNIRRRDFMHGLAALAAGGGALSGQTRKLPAREEFVIRNAFVMTMDAAGDLPNGDVHVRNGEIVGVGRALKTTAKVIDGQGMIVLPGLIETHWHMWNLLMRSLAGDQAERGYFAMSPGIGRFYNASDMYQGTRLAAAEAIHSGITFVHDWCHNVRGPEYAEADLRALAESGIRARFSYGTAQAQPATP